MTEEIILNLWYVCTEDGTILSLRGQAYIYTGADQEKLRFLQKQAYLDYMNAKAFILPTASDVSVQIVFHERLMPALGGPLLLFEEVIRGLEKSMQTQTKLKIPKDPLVCITPLLMDEHKNLYPRIDQIQYF